MTDLYRGYEKVDGYSSWPGVPNGALLYVGISDHIWRRLQRHESSSEWAAGGVDWRIDEYPTHKRAHAAEIAAIHEEEPLFNKRRYRNRRAWTALAACRGESDLFGSDVAAKQRRALAICARCPVRRACRAEARLVELPNRRYEVRGGLTAKQRGWG